MKQIKSKIASAVCMFVFAVGILMGMASNFRMSTGYAYYFRDNNALNGDMTLVSYADAPWEKYQSILDREQLETADAIPSLPRYNKFFGSGYYRADGSIYALRLVWQYEQPEMSRGEYKQLELTVVPGGVDDSARWDGMFRFDPDAVTKTRVDGVTVYGDGTGDTAAKALMFTLPDGTYCQIYALRNTTFGEMGRVLRFCLEGKLNMHAFLEKH